MIGARARSAGPCAVRIVYADPASADASWDIAGPVRGYGAERLLTGTDSPYFDHRLLQRQIETAPLDDATKDRIAWRNAASLI